MALATVFVFAWVLPTSTADGAVQGNCTIVNGVPTCVATDPGSPGGGGGGSSGSGCVYQGHGIPCQLDGGWWFPSQLCYAKPGNDALGPGGQNAPGPNGQQGTWWQCFPTTLVNLVPGLAFFVPSGQAPAPDPAALGRQALGQIQLVTARVTTAPAPPHPEVVGVEVWLWVPQGQWQTLTKTVTAGSTSVTATAVPTKVVWDMGDGSQPTVCYGPGREWLSTYTDSAQTDCGYTYRTLSASQPGGVFNITATISYAATWTCTGVCTSPSGDLGTVGAPAGAGSIKSVQQQTVVIQR